MTERIGDETLYNGAGNNLAPLDTAGGFDVAEVWQGAYNFREFGDGQTHRIPAPTQEQIDTFSRKIAKLEIDLERTSEKQRAAREKQAKERAESEQGAPRLTTMKEVDKLMKEAAQIIAAQKDAVAEVCSGEPGRAELEKLPQNMFIPFYTYVVGLILPEA